MKGRVIDFNNKSESEISINPNIFGVTPKESVLNKVVDWQRAKKQSGNHNTKGISQVSGTTKKPHNQKGTGNARLGSKRAPQCRGGGIIFGPQPRDHSYSLPKKVRKLGLKMALSARYSEDKLYFVDDFKMEEVSTKKLSTKLKDMKFSSLLIITDEKNVDDNFIKSAMNIKNVNLLPQIGANVYDILKHSNIIISKSALSVLEQRLG